MRSILFGAVVLALHAAPALATDASPACEAKRTNIELQIEEATKRGNSKEVAGLRKALQANKDHCTQASLEKEREKQIRQAEKKVQEREKSLAEAERKGDAKKIANRKSKLEEAHSDLLEAEKPLPR